MVSPAPATPAFSVLYRPSSAECSTRTLHHLPHPWHTCLIHRHCHCNFPHGIHPQGCHSNRPRPWLHSHKNLCTISLHHWCRCRSPGLSQSGHYPPHQPVVISQNAPVFAFARSSLPSHERLLTLDALHWSLHPHPKPPCPPRMSPTPSSLSFFYIVHFFLPAYP